MDVIPLILTESMTLQIPIEYLTQLASCSTEIIKQKIESYLHNSKANMEVQTKIKEAFSEQLQMEEYLCSDSLKETVSLVQSLDYYDITPHLTIEQLKSYKEDIETILDSEYAVPYIAPISGTLIKDLQAELKEYAKAINNKEIKLFADNLKKYSKLFRDSQYAPHKGTIVKKVVRHRTKYEIIVRGIDFMLDKKEHNCQPSSWRYL